MNSTYTLNEGNDALNRVLLMMRYDLSKTLSENIVVEQPDSRFDTRYNRELMKKYELPAKTMTLDEFMEDYRDALTNPFMVGLEVFLTSTGVGVTAVVAAYTVLLAYDVYKGVKEGEWDWLNIVFDVLGIVSSGVLSSTLRPIMQGAKGLKLNTLGKVLEYLSKTKIWKTIKPYLIKGIDLLKSLSKNIWKTLEWISRKTGFRQLKTAGKSVETNIHNIIYSIEEFLKNSVKKTVKFLEPGANVGIKQALKRGVISAGFAAAFPLGVEAIHDKLIKPKLKGGSFEYSQLNPEDNVFLRDYYVKNNKEYFPNGINKIEFASDKQKNLIGLRIDGKMYQIVDEKKYKLKKI